MGSQRFRPGPGYRSAGPRELSRNSKNGRYEAARAEKMSLTPTGDKATAFKAIGFKGQKLGDTSTLWPQRRLLLDYINNYPAISNLVPIGMPGSEATNDSRSVSR